MQTLELWQVRGANKAVAERLGISDAAVSQWRHNGIPKKHQEIVRQVMAELLAPRAEQKDAANV